MLGLVEGAVGLGGDVAQMGEVDVRRELARERWDVVVGAGTEKFAQKVNPLAELATAASSARRSSPVDTTRGSPNSGNGGSSGWTASRTPASSATGATARRNAAWLARRSVAVMPA